MKKFLGLLLLLLPVFVLTACSTASGREITVEMTNYHLTPTATPIQVKPGERITWVLVNKSNLDHEFESDEGNLEEVLVPAGKTKRVEWTAPQKPGSYTMACDMVGHDGMEMTVEVKE
jgi:uncharacterized cupredoxin-like copper-binding protein